MSTREFMRTAIFLAVCLWLIGVLITGGFVYLGFNIILIQWLNLDLQTLTYFQCCVIGVVLTFISSIFKTSSYVKVRP